MFRVNARHDSMASPNRHSDAIQRTYERTLPTFLRWHDPDQVQRDQGGCLISAHAGAPSGIYLQIVTWNSFPVNPMRATRQDEPRRTDVLAHRPAGSQARRCAAN